MAGLSQALRQVLARRVAAGGEGASVRQALSRLVRGAEQALPVGDVSPNRAVGMFVPWESKSNLAGPFTDRFGASLGEFSDDSARLIDTGFERLRNIWRKGERRTVALGELLDHPELFQRFPWMRRVRVGGDAGGDMAHVRLGTWSPRGDRINMDFSRHTSNDQALSTLLHEIQHVTQHAKGMMQGGHPTTSEQIYFGGYYPAWRRISGEDTAVLTQERQPMTLAQRADAPPEFIGEIPRAPATYASRDPGLRVALLKALAAGGGLGAATNIALNSFGDGAR